MRLCTCCHIWHDNDRDTVDGICLNCNINYIYKTHNGNTVPDWVKNLDIMPIDETSLVLVYDVDLRCVRRAMRELLTKMYPGYNIILINTRRDMLGIINVPSYGILKGVVFYATKDVGKLSPELAISLESIIGNRGDI